MGQIYLLRPEQRDAADHLYQTDLAMVLAPVGGGKTAVTLTAMSDMNRDGHAKRWLVIAPKRVCKHVWPEEIKKWWPDATYTLAFGSPTKRNTLLNGDATITIINYENMASLAHCAGDFDGVVFDELTRLKNPSGVGFKFIDKWLNGRVKYRWGLTGSFTSNGLEDVFGQCKIIDVDLLGRSKGAFLQRYFICLHRDHGVYAPIRGALEIVMEKIKPSTYVLDAGKYYAGLPPLRVVPVSVPMENPRPYFDMRETFVVRHKSEIITALTAGSVTNKLQQIASGFAYVGEPRQTVWFGGHKFDKIDEILAENQRANTIIVYNYQEELAELKRRYPKAWTIDMPDAVSEWNAGRVQTLLVHPKSAGHGLNLQNGGCHMIFVSLPWSLELYEQTIGRLHRGGQTRPVWVWIINAHKTIDERIFKALSDKKTISDIAIEELSNNV